MPFVQETHIVQVRQKAFLWLMRTFGYSQKQAQKILDKSRLTQHHRIIDKSQEIIGEVLFLRFVPFYLEIPKVLQTPHFVIYNKPHKLLTHPKGIYPHLSLCDALKYEFGDEANPIHRLDRETAGLILCATSKTHENTLKLLFEKHQIRKTYLARVRGKITEARCIDAPILTPSRDSKQSDLSIRSRIHTQGKASQTYIKPLSYDAHSTLLLVSPLTGRTHQIRLHLAHIGHPILGDPLYGCDDAHARIYLEEELSDVEREIYFGSSFLHLWAYGLEFEFLGERYCVKLDITHLNSTINPQS